MKKETGDDMYLIDVVEDWLFSTAEKIQKMEIGTDEYLLTVKAWEEVYVTWLDHKKSGLDIDYQDEKFRQEKSIERMKLIFGLITGVATVGMSWGGYLLFGKVMQQWEDKGHIPLGTALKGLIRGAKTPKI